MDIDIAHNLNVIRLRGKTESHTWSGNLHPLPMVWIADAGEHVLGVFFGVVAAVLEKNKARLEKKLEGRVIQKHRNFQKSK